MIEHLFSKKNNLTPGVTVASLHRGVTPAWEAVATTRAWHRACANEQSQLARVACATSRYITSLIISNSTLQFLANS